MSDIEFYNWDDGSVGIGSAEVNIYASRLGKSGGFITTTLTVSPGCLHYVGRPESEDFYGVETVRAAFAAKAADAFPEGEGPVLTTVQANLSLDGFGARRADGNRFDTHKFERLPVPCSREEVDAARARLVQSVCESLADINQYWDDQGPEALAEMVARSEAEIAAARSRADA